MGQKSTWQLSRQQNLMTCMPSIAPNQQLTPLVPAVVIPAATNPFCWYQNPVALSGATNTSQLDDAESLASSEVELLELEDKDSQHNNTRSTCEEFANMMQWNLDQWRAKVIEAGNICGQGVPVQYMGRSKWTQQDYTKIYGCLSYSMTNTYGGIPSMLMEYAVGMHDSMLWCIWKTTLCSFNQIFSHNSFFFRQKLKTLCCRLIFWHSTISPMTAVMPLGKKCWCKGYSSLEASNIFIICKPCVFLMFLK